MMKRLLIAVLLLGGLAAGQEIRRPTAETANTCTNAASGRDASTATAANCSGTVSVSYPNANTASQNVTYYTWASASGSYSSLSLKVLSQFTQSTGMTGTCDNADASGRIEYSINGGSTWTTIWIMANADRVQQTDTVSLSPSQNMSQLRVRITSTASAGCSIEVGSSANANASLEVYDVRTEGVLASAAKPVRRILNGEE